MASDNQTKYGATVNLPTMLEPIKGYLFAVYHMTKGGCFIEALDLLIVLPWMAQTSLICPGWPRLASKAEQHWPYLDGKPPSLP